MFTFNYTNTLMNTLTYYTYTNINSNIKASDTINKTGQILETYGELAYLNSDFLAKLTLISFGCIVTAPIAQASFITGHDLVKVGKELQKSSEKLDNISDISQIINFKTKDFIKDSLKDTWVLKHAFSLVSPFFR